MSQDTWRVLVVGRQALRDEVERAAGQLREVRVVLRGVDDHRRALEVIRDRRHDLVLIGMGGPRDAQRVAEFADDVAHLDAHVSVVGCYAAGRLEPAQEAALYQHVLRSRVADLLRRPLSSAELGPLLRRLRRAPTAEATQGARITAFMSNKGGVGKSTLATNVAVGLADRHPGRVLLVDLSLQLGVCASMLDAEPKATWIDVARERERLDEVLLRQLTAVEGEPLHLLGAPPKLSHGDEIDEDVLARVLTLARRTFDHVIVDTFPLIESLNLAVLDACDAVYVIALPTVPCAIGVGELLGVLEVLGVGPDRAKVVLNHAHPRFPGELSVGDVEERLERSIDHSIPYSKRVLVALNSGRPAIRGLTGWFGAGRALRAVVDAVESAGPRPSDLDPSALRAVEPLSPEQEESLEQSGVVWALDPEHEVEA